jgi:hypothetical protein
VVRTLVLSNVPRSVVVLSFPRKPVLYCIVCKYILYVRTLDVQHGGFTQTRTGCSAQEELLSASGLARGLCNPSRFRRDLVRLQLQLQHHVQLQLRLRLHYNRLHSTKSIVSTACLSSTTLRYDVPTALCLRILLSCTYNDPPTCDSSAQRPAQSSR